MKPNSKPIRILIAMMNRRAILLIEDEESISEPLAAALRREGFDVLAAGSAADGLETFRTRSPDLVLLDVMLSDGDGKDVLREIRRSSRTPVVMLTARGEEMDRVLGLELGADDPAPTTAVTPAPEAGATTTSLSPTRRSRSRSGPRVV
jgi:CheY-like chemotaxis protein